MILQFTIFISALGDPLIKGLTEVATARPKDPVTYLASYLYNFANQDKPKDNEQVNYAIPFDKLMFCP